MKLKARKVLIQVVPFDQMNAQMILPFLVIVTGLMVPFVALTELLVSRHF